MLKKLSTKGLLDYKNSVISENDLFNFDSYKYNINVRSYIVHWINSIIEEFGDKAKETKAPNKNTMIMNLINVKVYDLSMNSVEVFICNYSIILEMVKFEDDVQKFRSTISLEDGKLTGDFFIFE